MRTIVGTVLALSMLAGVAGRVMAQTFSDIDPNDSKQYLEQLDREGRGGQGNG